MLITISNLGMFVNVICIRVYIERGLGFTSIDKEKSYAKNTS